MCARQRTRCVDRDGYENAQGGQARVYSLAVAGTTIDMGIVINDSVLQHTTIDNLIGQ